MKNKLILFEGEMITPKGHFLDNLIESTIFFKDNFNIFWFLNCDFNDQGTFIPKDITINRVIKSNTFKRKNNKILYFLKELFILLKNLILSFFLIFYFLFKKNFINYFLALYSNNFMLPKYFFDFYFKLKKINFNKNDHILFQTCRNKDIKLANFLLRVDKDLPKIHLRILYTPKIKTFNSFFHQLKKIKKFLRKDKAFIYVLTEKNKKLLSDYNKDNYGIFLSNIPWVFFNRETNSDLTTIGYLGDARINRGFHRLPDLINILEMKCKDLKYIIQFSKADKSVLASRNKLIDMAKKNNRITIIEKYCDYQDFRNVLQKINIMPILHNTDEIINGNPSTIYSSITHEIPMVIPKNLNYMNKILKFKSFEEATDLVVIADKILKIKNNYQEYLLAAKKNSNILHEIFNNDFLKKNIR